MVDQRYERKIMIGNVVIQTIKKIVRRLNRKFKSEAKRNLNEGTALTLVSSTNSYAKIDSDGNETSLFETEEVEEEEEYPDFDKQCKKNTPILILQNFLLTSTCSS